MTSPFPEWIRRNWASGEGFQFTRELVADLGLHTVCQSAHCPNQGECWRRKTATLMILGNVCTRNCRYCSVTSGRPAAPPEPDEPERVAEAVHRMGLLHAVITSVTRDDLEDGGARHFAETIEAIRTRCPQTAIEVLTPDFQGRRAAVETVLAAKPDVFGHNIETVERLFPKIRSRRFSYRMALDVLETASRYPDRPVVKSALMLGHGETEDEVRAAFADLLSVGCDAVSLGQYLRPTRAQREVVEYVRPERFRAFEEMAYAMGFTYALAGPFVRSSYRADELLKRKYEEHGAAAPARSGDGEDLHDL